MDEDGNDVVARDLADFLALTVNDRNRAIRVEKIRADGGNLRIDGDFA